MSLFDQKSQLSLFGLPTIFSNILHLVLDPIGGNKHKEVPCLFRLYAACLIFYQASETSLFPAGSLTVSAKTVYYEAFVGMGELGWGFPVLY